MPKEQLLQEFAQAYEHLMETASLAAQRWVTGQMISVSGGLRKF
jgi:NAD(P)-dependent dehydrogenase (short-subunit alcohol dehydrogenase family)